MEVRVRALEIVGPAQTPAIPVARKEGEDLPAEELRLKYRVLDLRRSELQQNLILRHRLLQRARSVLTELEFLEIETPILTKPTPEGARDYLVPSRVHPGEFYALPQSPQIYKQLLMVAGFDRYFQIARCFRDEDLRADRQPEFTQIDIESSFVTQEDVQAYIEAVLVALWEEAGESVQAPFVRLPHREAMEHYGIDKPDLRFGFEIRDLSSAMRTDAADFVKAALAGRRPVARHCRTRGRPCKSEGARRPDRRGQERKGRRAHLGTTLRSGVGRAGGQGVRRGRARHASRQPRGTCSWRSWGRTR